MATKTVKVSDLTGEVIPSDLQLARIIIAEHPSLSDPVTLEVLDEEVEDRIPKEQNFVRGTYFPAGESGGGPISFVLSVEEFNNLSPDQDMETILSNASAAQQEEETRKRGRRGRRGGGQKRPRVDYASPEHAGEPHQGRIRDAEKEYVRNNLNEVNARLERDGYRTIDPEDPELAERYGLFSTE